MISASKKYLRLYPDVPAIYFTADGMPFLRKAAAKAHADTLSDKEVKTVKRIKEGKISKSKKTKK